MKLTPSQHHQMQIGLEDGTVYRVRGMIGFNYPEGICYFDSFEGADINTLTDVVVPIRDIAWINKLQLMEPYKHLDERRDEKIEEILAV